MSMGASGLRIHVATQAHTRLLGLLARPPLSRTEALALHPCGAIHTCFMRYAIDVVYLDANDKVLRVVAAVRPWRLSACLGARTTLELLAGEAARLGLHRGMQIAWRG